MEEIRNEEIYNSIALQQQAIEELKQVLDSVETSETDKIKLKIETKHWYRFSEPGYLKTNKYKLNISKNTMEIILKEAINKHKEEIEELIDEAIENRTLETFSSINTKK